MKDVKAAFSINPRSTALMVIDMQNAFLDERSFLAVRMGMEMIPRLKDFMGDMRAKGVPIVYTRAICRPDGGDLGVMRELFHQIDSLEHYQEGTRGAEICEDLWPQPGDMAIAKRRFSAFYGTDLEILLRSRKVDTLIFTGVNTNICVESTAREAFFRDFRVVVVSDLTGTIPSLDGTMSDREVHNATLHMFDGLYGFVFSSDEVLARMRA